MSAKVIIQHVANSRLIYFKRLHLVKKVSFYPKKPVFSPLHIYVYTHLNFMFLLEFNG